ncbi:MAG: mechanosensitive ion channel, partial [Deltaproteobacteria bacterium]|nr:mechanosensitive ion channel [Deltaproteobacteria bacterium]
GPDLLGAAVILILGWWAARLASRLVRRMMTRAEIDGTLVGFAANLTYMAAIVFVIISALSRLGVNTTSFAAVIAAAGLAIGFALQGSLANFAAGVMLIVFRPFKSGDMVEIGGVTGAVREIQVFHTVLTTPDNKMVIIGNAAVTGSTITNYSAMETRRVDLVFGIGYGDDIRQAKRVIEGVLAGEERVLKDPPPVLGVGELGDSCVNIVMRAWVETADWGPVRFELNERVKLAFDAAGIEIPFPQRDVHVKSAA